MTESDYKAYFAAAEIVRTARQETKRLEAERDQRLAPHKVMQKQIEGLYTSKLALLEAEETAALEVWREMHAELTVARREALTRGENPQPLALPEGVSLREDRVVSVTDLSVVPLEYLAPNLKAIRGAERQVPGTAISFRPTLVCRS